MRREKLSKISDLYGTDGEKVEKGKINGNRNSREKGADEAILAESRIK